MDALKNSMLYEKCKKIVKTWEHNFMETHGRRPAKLDIREADKYVRDAYGTYYKLKTAALEESLMDILDEDEDKNCTEPEDPHTELNPINLSNQEESTSIPEEPTTSQKESTTSQGEPTSNQEEPSTNQDCTKSKEDQIWGEHLNNKTALTFKPKLTLKSDMNSSFTKKLFANSKFMKRNPRKSFQNQSSCDLNNSESCSQSEETINDASQSVTFNCTSQTEEININFNSSLRVASNTQTISSQSVNIISQILDNSVNKSTRKIDKGWLHRVSTNTNITDKENMFKPCDSDDIISGSDTEDNISIFQAVKRIKLSPTYEKSSPVITNQQIERPVVAASIELKINQNLQVPVIESNNEKTELFTNITDTQAIRIEEESEEIIVKKFKTRKKIESDTESDYEAPKTINKRKRKVITKKLKGPKSKISPTRRQTPRNTKNKKVSELENPPDDAKTEDYAPEFSIKPPPVTVPRFKELLTTVNQETPDEIKIPPVTKRDIAKAKLMKKIESGSLNENFVRIDIKKKIYVRGKKGMNFTKYKKQQWKNKKKSLYGPDMDMGGCDGGELVCFKCGKTGHFARRCKEIVNDQLLPLEAIDEDECTLPSLQEATQMAKDSVLAVNVPNLIQVGSETASDPINSKPDEYEFNNDEELEEFILNTENFEEIPDDTTSNTSCSQQYIDENQMRPLYSLKPDGSIQDTPAEVYEALQQFGHTSFRSGQEQAVMRILSGLSTLVTLSTGSGKSLCYQLPAYLYAKRKNCISLIISPLVSLMEDQVSGIPAFLKAACLHTGQTKIQREKVMKLIETGDLNVLLISPEAVTAGEKKTGFGSLFRMLPPIAFACIDEAHCVSQWSHNFRPSYLVICRVLKERLGIKTILGLTATSTHATSSSIVEHLEIPDGRQGVISDIPLPDNLFLSVSSDMQRDAALRNLLNTEPFESFDSIIIYCTRREECERIASYLRTSIRKFDETKVALKKYKSLSAVAEPYHAGLPASKRRTVQNAFMGGHLRIVVATVAFGMGINKADIRCVIHYNMPRNFESYVQEVGRAGRDGLPAQCHLFLDAEGRDQFELKRHIYTNSMDRHAIRKLLQKIFVPCGCKKVCPRHEVAFSIEETVKLLDVPEENISTLLCYLELHEKQYLELLTPVYTYCKIITYGGPQHIRKASKDCPPLAMALALHKKTTGDEFNENVFEFQVVDVAAAMGWDSGFVKSKLKNLEWLRDNNMPKRSKLTVEFSNLGFHLRAPGNLPPSELDDALDTLYAKKIEQETTSLQQLQVVHSTLTAAAEKHYSLCLAESYTAKSHELKTSIREYFNSEQPLKDVDITSVRACNEGHIISDIRNLVGMYRDNNFTGRAIARIFHGIQSPNYPAVIWGRCKYWRAHLSTDFNQVCRIATVELLKLK